MDGKWKKTEQSWQLKRSASSCLQSAILTRRRQIFANPWTHCVQNDKVTDKRSESEQTDTDQLPEQQIQDSESGTFNVGDLFDSLGDDADPAYRSTFIDACGGRNFEPKTWFDNLLMKRVEENDEWLQLLGMKKRTLLRICYQVIAWSLKHHNTGIMERDIPVPQQLAATIFHLTKRSSLDGISDKFGIEYRIIPRVMNDAIHDIAAACGRCIRFGSATEKRRVSELIQQKWGLQNCQGAVGFTSVTILPCFTRVNLLHSGFNPQEMRVMAVCDAEGRYLDFACEAFTASPSNLEMFTNTDFYRRFRDEHRRRRPAARFRGPFVVVHLPQDSIPHAIPFMVEPSQGPDRDDAEAAPTARELLVRGHRQGMGAINEALHDLKATFQALNSNLGMCCSERMAETYIRACLILHNIVRMVDAGDDLRQAFR